jgi:hypothetical protein
MADSNDEFRSCAVCERSILRGERVTDYVDGDGETVPVCALCKPRAEASGWIPAALAATVSRGAGARRRASLAVNLRERFARRASVPPGDAPDPEPRPPDPLEVFNASHEARKVSGLVRSLGEPRVSVRAESDASQVVTVAWELSWYQWAVDGTDVRQVGKGNEISELAVDDREWNASVGENGQLRLD